MKNNSESESCHEEIGDNKASPKSKAEILLEPEIVIKWTNEQLEAQKGLKFYDTEPWQINRSLYSQDKLTTINEHLRYVAGMDISFAKNDNLACSGLFVFDITDNMKIVYKDVDSQPVTMNLPYVPGFLAYREAPLLLSKLSHLKKNQPDLYPHCILIDGNGCLHENGYGMACHIGLESDTPTIGVSKKLFQVRGLENNPEHKCRIKQLHKAGDYFELYDSKRNEVIGLCYRATDKASNPIYVSLGHKISWSTCLWVLSLVIKKYRIPEPIRQADILTREFIRNLNI